MTLITLENITKTFGAQTLFTSINASVSSGEKIGLIGVNGTGKSTLLRIISGLESVDDGKITRMRGLRVSHLLQNPVFEPQLTATEQVIHFLEEEAAQISTYEIATMLNHLGLEDHDQTVGSFSGGLQKRIALAAVLLKPCDLLILDEPTNHMDNETIEWLEAYLKRMRCAIIMVTHDRYFLNRMISRIFEITDGVLYAYEGRYETYLEYKQTRLQEQQSSQKKMKNLYLRELAWMRAGVQARGTKSKSRIQRFEAIEAEMNAFQAEALKIETAFTRLGKKILEMEGLCFGYDTPLNKPLTYITTPNARIGIVGPNGSGKTTLLETLAGNLTPISGQFELGPTVKLGYFSQNPETDVDEQMRAIDYIRETAHFVTTPSGFQLSASDLMEQFLFGSALQYTPIGSLSGGERRRLQLLKILIDAPNVLLLDEPTNNLDLDTLKALEQYFDHFEGVVICVSHDRYFLDRVCEQLFTFENSGVIEIFHGDCSDYLATRNTTLQPEKADQTSKVKTERTKSVKKKLSFKEERALETLPVTLERLETELDAVNEAMTKNAADYAKVQTFFNEKERLEAEYLEALEAYENLLALKAEYEG